MQVAAIALPWILSLAHTVDDLPGDIEQRQPHHQKNRRHLCPTDNAQRTQRIPQKERPV